MQSKSATQTILIPGGLGYIGSHTIVELIESLLNKKIHLLESNYKVTIVDDLSNSTTLVISRINQILRASCPDYSEDILEFEKINIKNFKELETLFQTKCEKNEPISYIIHFAAKKAVGESTQIPLEYFENNFVGSLNLLKCMEKYNCKNFIFSSSATVYGNNGNCKEEDPLTFANPYGCTKLCVEHMLEATAKCKSDWRIISLRYFNPCGAHESGLIGESPSSFPNNLFPFLEDVAIGKRERLNVFGDDYETNDGTGVRDYIHVVDLAKAHINALEKIHEIQGYEVYNLGTGCGYSVLEILNAYSRAIGKEIPYKVVGRRPGDIDISKCVPEKAHRELKWKAEKSLEDMCKDSYRWKINNPNGFEEKENSKEN